MIRLVCLCVLGAALLEAQDKPVSTLAALQQDADKKAKEWDVLARGLETKIARLLPCDGRVRSAIEEVGRASEARLTSLREYLEAAAAKAKDDAAATQRLIANQAALITEMTIERTEAEQVRNGTEGQLAALAGIVSRRPALDEAQNSLASITGTLRQRATQAQQQSSRSDALAGLLQELDVAYQSRLKALDTEIGALAAETARWSEYYILRSARSQTECTITNMTVTVSPAPRPAQGKKR